MPFKDPAARAAYMRRYWDDYLARPDPDHGTKADAAKARKAAWHAKNKARLTAKKRRSRRVQAVAERIGIAIAITTTGQCDMSHRTATCRTHRKAGQRKAAA